MNTRFGFILNALLICAILSACGPSQAELASIATQAELNDSATQTAKAPTATATFTPSPTATSTPTPTLTPTLTPTATPTPTKDPLAGEYVDGKFVINAESFNQLVRIGQNIFDDEDYLYEALLYDAMLEYSLTTDQLIHLFSLQSEDYEYLGHYNLAINDLLQIINLGDRRPGYLNSLCWDYAITDQPDKALPYCEEAVAKDPSSQTLDSRAVVYALLGRYPDAVSDFEAALQQDDFPNENMKAQRQEWVKTLKAGNNPVTDEVLAEERGEQASLTVDPWFTGDMTLSSLRKQFEDDGYVFKDTVIDGHSALTSTIQEGDCKVDLILLRNGQEFVSGTTTITGCSHDDLDRYSWDFIWAFTLDLNEMAHAIVWDEADVYYVIEGKPATNLTPTFGGYQLSVERTSVDGAEGIVVTAMPSE